MAYTKDKNWEMSAVSPLNIPWIDFVTDISSPKFFGNWWDSNPALLKKKNTLPFRLMHYHIYTHLIYHLSF